MDGTFRTGPIAGVRVTLLEPWADERGWLAEIYREDELEEAAFPAMAYLSLTLPGITRGPHEHVDQTDLFAFLGPGEFKVTLWDHRPGSPTLGNRMEFLLGAQAPATLLVPPGVVHAYRCLGTAPGMVFNAPNRLFRGRGKGDPVDEIRHEADAASPFVRDERARRQEGP